MQSELLLGAEAVDHSLGDFTEQVHLKSVEPYCRVQERAAALGNTKADVLDRPITTLAVTEAGCLGVAMLACAADTGARLDELVRNWVKPQQIVEPDPARAAAYRERFEMYQRVYPSIRELWR